MAIITGPLLRFSIPNDFPVKHAAPWRGLPLPNLPAREPWTEGRSSRIGSDRAGGQLPDRDFPELAWSAI